jgi:hypothetical protein
MQTASEVWVTSSLSEGFLPLTLGLWSPMLDIRCRRVTLTTSKALQSFVVMGNEAVGAERGGEGTPPCRPAARLRPHDELSIERDLASWREQSRQRISARPAHPHPLTSVARELTEPVRVDCEGGLHPSKSATYTQRSLLVHSIRRLLGRALCPLVRRTWGG